MWLRLGSPVLTLVVLAGLTVPRVTAHAAPGNPAAVAHVLNRLAYGPRPGDIAQVQQMGVQAWIERQLHPERIDNRGLEARLAGFRTLTLDAETLFRDYYEPAILARRAAAAGRSNPETPQPAPRETPRVAVPAEARNERLVLSEISEARLLRAVYSERQLEEVLTDFWFNHFNVFAGKGPVRAYVTPFERDVIRPHVLGRFRAMLEAVAASPAMLFYLDNWQNAAADAQMRRQAADAQMREQAADAQMRRQAADAQMRRQAADAQMRGQAADAQMRGRAADAQMRGQAAARMPRGINENFARELLELHTLGVDGGYTQDDIVNVARAFTGWTMRPRQGPAFQFVPALHDRSEKRVLGHTIKAGGIEDGRQVLDILVQHPATARHIATKLAQKFVSDTPPPALVDRAARRFLESRGDLREVTRVIVTAPEFLDSGVYRAKVKTPLEFVSSALRATGVEMATAQPLIRTLRDMGMPLYFCQPPTGYDETGDTWVSSGALVARMNFALELGNQRLRGIRFGDMPGADTLRSNLLRDALVDDVSDGTRATVAKAATPAQVVALIIGSPEFQRQ